MIDRILIERIGLVHTKHDSYREAKNSFTDLKQVRLLIKDNKEYVYRTVCGAIIHWLQRDHQIAAVKGGTVFC